MKNIENNLEKLTGMEGKSYHGNMMENNSDKQPERKSVIPEKEIGGKKISDVPSVEKGGKPAEKRSEASNWRNFSEKEKKEYFERIEKMAGESAKKKEPGLFDILMDILKELFGLKDKDAKEIIDNSEAMRGVQAYWRIKPQNKWEENDYARVIFMLNGDGSKEATAIKDKLYKDAEDKGIPKDKIKDKDRAREVIFSKTAELDKEYSGVLSKEGKALSDQERKVEMVHRAIAMNVELWEETVEKEEKFQTKLKEVKEKFKKFDPENQKKVRAAIESGDMYFFTHLLNLFSEYGTDSEVLERAAVSYVKAYKFNERNDLKISENAKQVYDLMSNVLSDLGIDESSLDSGSEERESRGKAREIVTRESRQGDQGKKTEGGDLKGVERVNNSVETDESEGGKKKGKKRPDGLKMTTKEYREAVIEKLGEISENTGMMLVELEGIRKELKNFYNDFMKTVIDDPEDFMRNPGKYKDKQAQYIIQRSREIAIENQLEMMIHGEKKILGGERDKYLYLGNINEVLDVRMKRIEFFHEMGKKEGNKNIIDPNGKSAWGDLGDVDCTYENLLLDPKENGISDVERVRRLKIREKNFRIQAKKAYEQFKEEGTLAKNEELYFKELQRWAGTILKNTDIGYTDKDGRRYSGGLKIHSEVYKKLKKIRAIEDKDLNYRNPDELEKKLLEQVKELRDLNFLDYFKNHSYLNFEGKGMNPLTNEVTGSMGYPHSLEGTMMLIAYNKGKEWQTGGEHELVDAEGKFHRENFLLWMRKEINVLIDWDPITAINAQGGITFKAGFSQLSLFDILYLPQYTQHQEFKIWGDAVRGNIENDWGLPEEHPDMKYDVRVNGENGIGILLEAWENDHEHKDYALLNNPKAWSSPDKWLEAREEISGFNNYTRAGLAFKRYMEGAHKKNKDGTWEDEAYYREGKQGSLGRSVALGHLFFRYFSDWTENYTTKGWDDEKNRETVIEVDRDNMAYQALGHNGASYFLQSLAESAFDHVDNTAGKDGKSAREEIKGAYRDFIIRRAEDIKEDIKKEYAADLDDEKNEKNEKKRRMEQLVKDFKKELDVKGEKLDEIKIGLDSYKGLTDLKMDIESKVLGKRIVSAEDKKKYGWKDEKVVVREEVEKEIGGEMRRNIKEFFEGFKNSEGKHIEGVIDIKIPVVPEKKSGEKEKIDRTKEPVAIGDIKVFTDANGRIVTEDEWDKMDAARRKTTTVGNIVRDFVNNFENDEKKLGDYEKNFRPIYVEYEQAKEEYDLAVASNSPDVATKKAAMDAKREKFKEYDDIVGRSESLGLALLTKVGNRSRDELNMFKRSRTNDNASTFDVDIKRALTKSLVKVYGLDEKIEGTYAAHRVWYPLFYMGIAGINNTSGFSGAIQPEAEYANFEKRRISRFDLGTGGGSRETLNEFRALVPGTFFEWTRVKLAGEGKPEHMLIEILQKAKGKQMEPNFMRDLEDNPGRKYEIPTKSESAFHEDGLKKAEAVRKLIIEDHEHEFEKIVYKDIWGAQRVDHEKALKIFGAWWDNIRQLFNNHGIDFESKISVHGREVKMMDYLFGEDTQKTLGIMKKYYEEYADKLEEKGKKDEAAAYRNLVDQLKSKPALAVFLNSVTASIHEHREMWGSYDQWSADTIDNIWVVLDEYLHQKSGLEYKVNDPKIKERPSMIPYELFNRLLGVHHEDSMEKYMFWDLFKCLVQGFVAGLGEAKKEVEDELTGQPKKQWIG